MNGTQRFVTGEPRRTRVPKLTVEALEPLTLLSASPVPVLSDPRLQFAEIRHFIATKHGETLGPVQAKTETVGVTSQVEASPKAAPFFFLAFLPPKKEYKPFVTAKTDIEQTCNTGKFKGKVWTINHGMHISVVRLGSIKKSTALGDFKDVKNYFKTHYQGLYFTFSVPTRTLPVVKQKGGFVAFNVSEASTGPTSRHSRTISGCSENREPECH